MPFHHRVELLEKAIESLAGMDCYVVNDGPLPLNQQSYQLIQHSIPNQGFACAANTGLSHAQCDGFSWVLLLNDDATIDAQSLQRMVDKIGPDMGAIGPVIYDPNGDQSASISVGS